MTRGQNSEVYCCLCVWVWYLPPAPGPQVPGQQHPLTHCKQASPGLPPVCFRCSLRGHQTAPCTGRRQMPWPAAHNSPRITSEPSALMMRLNSILQFALTLKKVQIVRGRTQCTIPLCALNSGHPSLPHRCKLQSCVPARRILLQKSG